MGARIYFESVHLINKDNNCEIMANILENFLNKL